MPVLFTCLKILKNPKGVAFRPNFVAKEHFITSRILTKIFINEYLPAGTDFTSSY